jgi:hypothetical protein
MSWIVICEDGRQRHDGLFATVGEAEEWANWGHLCTSRHRIVDPDITEGELAQRWTHIAEGPTLHQQAITRGGAGVRRSNP